MHNVYEHFQKRATGDRNKWREVWREERIRRVAGEWFGCNGFGDDEWRDEQELLFNMGYEQTCGALWICPTCKAEYEVMTPFHRLYCAGCLSKLKSHRIVPVLMAKLKVKRHKFWTCEDDRG